MCNDCGTTTPSEFRIYGKAYWCDSCWIKFKKANPDHPWVKLTR